MICWKREDHKGDCGSTVSGNCTRHRSVSVFLHKAFDHGAAAELLRKGIDGPKIIEKTFYEKTYAQNQVLGKALLESIRLMDGK